MGAMSPAEITPPEKLSSQYDLSEFGSGEPVLDDWLRRRALHNEATGASRTYVVRAGKRLAGYYSLAVGAAAHVDSPGRVRRNMPDPIPVMILGRLAVDNAFHGRGVGTGLLRDAVLRTMQVAEIAGVRALLVHAISDPARRFYERHGFISSPIDPLTLLITVADAARFMADKSRRS
jgi:GNAT superfamily N-acetyltransferase